MRFASNGLVGGFCICMAACNSEGAPAAVDEPGPVVQAPPDRQGGPEPTVRVWLEPADLSTDVATTPLTVRVQWPSTPPTLEALENLRAAVSLTDARGQGLPVVTTEARGDLEASNGTAEFQVVPERPLENGWYSMRLDGLTGLYETSPVQRIAGREGSVAARFHVGSAPLIQHVQVCERSAGHWTVLAEFSERVRTGEALAMARLLRPGGPECSLDREVDAMIPPADDDDSLLSLRWGCDDLSVDEVVSVVVPSGIHSLVGTDVLAETLDVSRRAGVNVSDRCTVIRGSGGPLLPTIDAP
jgi:hypothetical protein